MRKIVEIRVEGLGGLLCSVYFIGMVAVEKNRKLKWSVLYCSMFEMGERGRFRVKKIQNVILSVEMSPLIFVHLFCILWVSIQKEDKF